MRRKRASRFEVNYNKREKRFEVRFKPRNRVMPYGTLERLIPNIENAVESAAETVLGRRFDRMTTNIDFVAGVVEVWVFPTSSQDPEYAALDAEEIEDAIVW